MQSSNRSHLVTTLTLCMKGTNEGPLSQTVITSLFDSLSVSKTHTKYLINGLGSTSTDSDGAPGTYDFNVAYDDETGNLNAKKTIRTSDQITRLRGLAYGFGYKDAFREALEVVDKLVAAGGIPLKINLIGFSRGADTLLRFCNLLNVLYPNGEIEVNFLAIDTVPGPGRRKAKKARRIPPIVKRYECVYMKHERRKEFALQDKNSILVDDMDQTEVITHILSGPHSHAERFTADPTDPKSKCIDAGKILWEITRRFAETCGSIISGDMPYVRKMPNGQYQTYQHEPLDDKEYLNCYTRMVNEEEDYFNLNRSMAVEDRRFVKRKQDHFLHGNTVFQDRTHLLLFKKQYPYFFDYFFQKNKAGSEKEKVKQDISRLKENELLYNYIKKCIPVVDSVELGEPQGIPILEEDFYQKNNKLRRLWESLQSILFDNIAGYESSITSRQADEILLDVHSILISDTDQETKIKKIENAIREKIAIYAGKEIVRKLCTLLPGNENPLLAPIRYLEKSQATGNYDDLCLHLTNKFVEVIKVREGDGTHTEKRKKIEELLRNLQAEISAMPVKSNNPEANNFEIHDDKKPTEEKLSCIFHSQETKDTIIRCLKDVIKNSHRFVDEAKKLFIPFLTERKSSKISSIADLGKSCLEIIDLLGSQNDTAAIKQILSAALAEIKKIDPSHKLVKEINHYIFNLGTGVQSQHDESETVKEQLKKFNSALRAIVNPEAVIFDARLQKILDPLHEFASLNTIQANIIGKTIQALTNLSKHSGEIDSKDIEWFLQTGYESAMRLRDDGLKQAFANALIELEKNPTHVSDDKYPNRLIGQRKRIYEHEMEIISPCSLLEKTIKLLNTFISNNHNDKLLEISNHCIQALVLLSQNNQVENYEAFNKVLQIAIANLPNTDNDLYSLLRNMQHAIPQKENSESRQNKQHEQYELNDAVKKILEDFERQCAPYLSVEFLFPYGHLTDRDHLVIPLDKAITLKDIKKQLKIKIREKYTKNEAVIDDYFNQLTIKIDGKEDDQPLNINENSKIEFCNAVQNDSFDNEIKLSKLQACYSDAVKLEQALRKKRYADISCDFISFAARRRHLKPINGQKLEDMIANFPNNDLNFNLSEQLKSLKNNKYKVSLYRKLDDLGRAIGHMQKQSHVDELIKTKYTKLYDQLLTDVQTSKSTSSKFDPLPVVMDHFTSLATRICRPNKPLTPNQMTASMTRLDRKLDKKKPIHPGLKAVICGVIGAVVGFSIGLVAGAIWTSWGGGFGALPGAIVGGVVGFTIATGVGVGVGGGVGLTASGFSLFQNWKNRGKYEEQKDNNRRYKDYIKINFKQ